MPQVKATLDRGHLDSRSFDTSNDIFSRTARPISIKLHMHHPDNRGTKVSSMVQVINGNDDLFYSNVTSKFCPCGNKIKVFFFFSPEIILNW